MKDEKAFAGFINEHVAFKAAEDSRKLTLPANPDAYKIELPTDFKPPEGIKFEFKPDDPLLSQAKTMAHEMGIGQENFSKLLSLYAGAQVATQAQITAARNAEVAKLGTAGPARIDALTTFFTAQLGETEGKQLMSRAFTASDVQVLEKLVTRMTSSGGSVRGTGREPPEQAGRVSNEQFAKMSAADRLDYARKFNQDQFQKTG